MDRLGWGFKELYRLSLPQANSTGYEGLSKDDVSNTNRNQHKIGRLANANLLWEHVPQLLLPPRNVQLIFARATSIKRSHKRVTYEGARASGELESGQTVFAKRKVIDNDFSKIFPHGFSYVPMVFCIWGQKKTSARRVEFSQGLWWVGPGHWQLSLRAAGSGLEDHQSGDLSLPHHWGHGPWAELLPIGL